MMRWGIVPRFAKSEEKFKALSTINIKSDRLTDSKMWREPFARRRSLVRPAALRVAAMPRKAIGSALARLASAAKKYGG
jgi:hypothetical protein